MSRMKVHRNQDELQDIIKGYKTLVETQRQEIFELKKVVSENEKNKNLLQGYKKVIEDLSIKLRKNS
jgi:diketogulonate reductase-like aldo/keto reductase